MIVDTLMEETDKTYDYQVRMTGYMMVGSKAEC